jgi:hypothetical protein
MSRDQENALIAETTHAVLELRTMADYLETVRVEDYTLKREAKQLHALADRLEACLGSEFTAELAKGFC